MRQCVLFVTVVLLCLPTVNAQLRTGVYGTYSNLARSAESGDLNGYELTLVAQSGRGAVAVFECAHGAESKTVFVPVQVVGRRLSFRIQDEGNDCNGDYSGVLVAGGLRLHSAAIGDTEFVPRAVSFWASTLPPATKYEKATDPLFDRLAMACPAKDLEEMAPADLDLQIEGFTPLLSVPQRRRFKARVEAECKDSIAGVGCGNVAFLEMAVREGYLVRFVKALCRADLVCTEQSVCGPADGRQKH